MPETVRIFGDLVAIREFVRSDAEDVQRIVGDDRVTNWLSYDSRGKKETLAMLDRMKASSEENPRTDYSLAVVTPPSDRVIGFCRIGLSGVKAGKLGYAIAYDEWGKGYATDVARTMVDFGFQKLGLHRISAAIAPDNTTSIKVVEKLGFSREGILRDHVFSNGAWRDSVLYSILQPEWADLTP